jgi:hypothetical protein
MLVNGDFITLRGFLVLKDAPDVLIDFKTFQICVFPAKK